MEGFISRASRINLILIVNGMNVAAVNGKAEKNK